VGWLRDSDSDVVFVGFGFGLLVLLRVQRWEGFGVLLHVPSICGVAAGNFAFGGVKVGDERVAGPDRGEPTVRLDWLGE
jgi:hypothetical protein